MMLPTICSFGVVLMVYNVEGGSETEVPFLSTNFDSTGCITEGGQVTLNLMRSNEGFGPSFSIETVDETAIFPADYTIEGGTSGLFALSTSVEVVIQAVDDGIAEGQETFTLRFTAPEFTALDVSFCIIESNPPPQSLAFIADEKTCVTESLSPLVIQISRPSSDTLAMNAAVTYLDGDADTTNDYVDSVTTLAFLNGESNAYLEVPIKNDLVVEPTEEFSITISAPGYDPLTIKGCINDDDRAVLFNCNRYGVTCAAGTCPPGGTTCDCSTALDRTGDNCGIIESNINGTGCSEKDCGSNGQCVSDGTVGVCVCNSGYYSGDEGKCELKRTTITSCDNNKMTICINPINTNNPLITVSGYTSNSCTADLVGDITDSENRIPSEIQGQCLTVGFNGDCGTYTATQQDDGNVCYTIPYRIQYNPNLIAASDEVVYAKCCVNPAGQTISTDAILADTATQFVNKQQEALNFLGVKLSATLTNGRAIDSPLPLNQIYELCLEITNDGFQYLGMIRIIVHNGQTDSSRQEAVVYGNDGCSDETGKSMVQSYPSRTSDKKICMQYKPGYFRPGPAAVVHDMTYKLCLAGDQAGCQLTQCGVTTTRKKRQANSGGVEATAKYTVSFNDESTSASQTNSETEVSPTAKHCSMDMSVIFPAIIVCCVVTLVLIVVIMYMCFLLMKKRRKQEDKQAELKSESSRRRSYPYRY